MCTKFSIACHFFSLELRGSIFCTHLGTVTRHILGYFRIKFEIDKVAKFCVKVLTLQEGMKFRSQKIHRDVPQSFLNLKMMLLFHLESLKLKKIGRFRVLIGDFFHLSQKMKKSFPGVYSNHKNSSL